MKVLIAGDYCPKHWLEEVLKQDICDYFPSEYLSLIKETADYSIVNFESPVVENQAVAIRKKGPHLKCSKEAFQIVTQMGFKCVTLANNHINDYGETGIYDTINECTKNEIDYVGVGVSIEDARKVLYKQIDNTTLAIINCCEHEFSIATGKKPGANPLDVISLYHSIVEAKTKADYVLVIIHGGHEMCQLPSLRMKETYHFLIDLGADAVVNHHQHCYSGYESYKGKPVFYGIGNFFDAPSSPKIADMWYYGYMVMIDFGEDIRYEIFPYEQCKGRPVLRITSKEIISKRINELNGIIDDDDVLREKMQQYYDSSVLECADVANPINNRFLLALQARNMFPSLLSKKWKTKMYDYVQCESLREKFVNFLNS